MCGTGTQFRIVLEKFEAFLQRTEPDVIHFHHFLTFGMEYFTAARRYLDSRRGRLVLDLPRVFGDLHGRWTNGSYPIKRCASGHRRVRCHQCFPDFSPEFFSLRKMWIKHHLDMVDVFVAPSQFLRQRYIEWGIPSHKIVHIPNGHRLNDSIVRKIATRTSQRNCRATALPFSDNLSIIRGFWCCSMPFGS